MSLYHLISGAFEKISKMLLYFHFKIFQYFVIAKKMNVINLFPGLVINLSYSYSLYRCHQGVGKKPENMSPCHLNQLKLAGFVTDVRTVGLALNFPFCSNICVLKCRWKKEEFIIRLSSFSS